MDGPPVISFGGFATIYESLKGIHQGKHEIFLVAN